MKRLIHDTSFAAAQELLATVAPALRPEEQHEALMLFLDIVKNAILEYETKVTRQNARLNPSRN